MDEGNVLALIATAEPAAPEHRAMTYALMHSLMFCDWAEPRKQAGTPDILPEGKQQSHEHTQLFLPWCSACASALQKEFRLWVRDFPLPRIFAGNLLNKQELSVSIAATQTHLHFSSCSPHTHFTSATRNQRNLDHFPCPRAKFTIQKIDNVSTGNRAVACYYCCTYVSCSTWSSIKEIRGQMTIPMNPV